ncbi:hypothetical protein VNI00_014648 [Paramarasmius palmivorus]|uniref:AA9 family lytic polysaccharide monooxygenase n=1 Tax=Paramarasmius palmivorus TaxID=297713 RepID=A0AAW0BVH3_9AGAR
MKSVLALLVLAAVANAHFTMQYLWVNGADQGQNVGIRVPPNNNPVTDVTSKDITCNVNGLSGANVKTIEVPSGAELTEPGEDAISGGHKGPVQVYIAKAHLPPPLPLTVRVLSGPRSTLLVSSRPSTQRWASDVVQRKQRQAQLQASRLSPCWRIPRPWRDGTYIAHCLEKAVISCLLPNRTPSTFASELPRWRSVLPRLCQIKITSGGSASPPKVALPGAYKGSDPGITVNIYNNLQSYTAPGPAVWSG